MKTRAPLVLSLLTLALTGLGQTLGARFTFNHGVNIVAGTPPWVVGSDVAYLKTLGFDHASIAVTVEDGAADFPNVADLVKRLNAAGLGAIIRPFARDMHSYAAWWGLYLARPTAAPISAVGVEYALGNEPGATLADWNAWRGAGGLQQALYAQIRKRAPAVPLIFSPASGQSWQMFSDSAGGLVPLWLPTGDPRIALDGHFYSLQPNGSAVGVNAGVVSSIVAYGKARNVALCCLEFDGGEGFTPWSQCVAQMALLARTMAGAGISYDLWHVSVLLDPQGRVRPDVLAAMALPWYAPPTTGSHVATAPAGSSSLGFGVTTTGN